MEKKPIVLCIMDGYGVSKRYEGNAVKQAKKPNLDYLLANYPNTLIEASGEAVGLPEGQMGNSEVGHQNIGAGRVLYQSLTLINKSIKDGSFYANEAYLQAVANVKENNSKLHIFGLLSDGGVHSHISHIKALIRFAKSCGLKDVYLHAFLDGRDVAPQSAINYIKEIKACFAENNLGKIATIAGRLYSMDRDINTKIIDTAYVNIVENIGNAYISEEEYILSQYQKLKDAGKNVTDEFVEPGYNENYKIRLENSDSVIFANFRPDRAIEISTVITNPHFYEIPALNSEGKPRWVAYVPKKILHGICFVCTMKYAESVNGLIAFEPVKQDNILGPYLAENNKTQLRIAETQKYAHVTFFFDGTINFDGVEKPELLGCKRILIPSPKVDSFDIVPEMSAFSITTALINELDKKDYDVIVVNYANCDMVGHTGNMEATIKAVECVDECIGRLYKKVDELGGLLIVTADHGNADCLIDENGAPVTFHTTAPVPVIFTNKEFKLKDSGKLADLAPTILSIMKLKVPSEMDGTSLIK